MDDLRQALKRMKLRLEEFGGALQDLQVEQRATTRQAGRVEEAVKGLTQQSEQNEEALDKLSRTFDLFKISVNDVLEGLIDHDTDQLRWRNTVEDRLSEIERRLAG